MCVEGGRFNVRLQNGEALSDRVFFFSSNAVVSSDLMKFSQIMSL